MTHCGIRAANGDYKHSTKVGMGGNAIKPPIAAQIVENNPTWIVPRVRRLARSFEYVQFRNARRVKSNHIEPSNNWQK